MTTTTVDELEVTQELPGIRLKEAREAKEYSTEYVAGRLHLRVRIIELLESDDYAQLPESVFVKGYIRAYAQLLDLDYAPLLEQYKQLTKHNPKSDRALWQSQREVNQGLHLVRWITLLSVLVVLVVVGVWWHKATDSLTSTDTAKQDGVVVTTTKKVTLTDINKMHTIVELPKKGQKRG